MSEQEGSPAGGRSPSKGQQNGTEASVVEEVREPWLKKNIKITCKTRLVREVKRIPLPSRLQRKI